MLGLGYTSQSIHGNPRYAWRDLLLFAAFFWAAPRNHAAAAWNTRSPGSFKTDGH